MMRMLMATNKVIAQIVDWFVVYHQIFGCTIGTEEGDTLPYRAYRAYRKQDQELRISPRNPWTARLRRVAYASPQTYIHSVNYATPPILHIGN